MIVLSQMYLPISGYCLLFANIALMISLVAIDADISGVIALISFASGALIGLMLSQKKHEKNY